MRYKGKIYCDYDICLPASLTFNDKLTQIAADKVEPDFVEVKKGFHAFGFIEPNTFFNKILTEIDIPDKHKDELMKDNIKSIVVDNEIKGNITYIMLANEKFITKKEGVQINLYTGLDKT